MKKPFEFAVSLRVVHPTMDPDLICKSLDWEAEYRWKAGAPRQTPKGTPLEGHYRSSYCSFEILSGDDGELAHCLRAAVERLEKYADFLRQMRADGGKIQFYVFWYPNGDMGETFSVDLLSRMAALGIDLGLNVYDDRHAETDPKPAADCGD